MIEPNTAQDASSAAASCLNAVPSGGVFTPTAASAIPTASAVSSGSSGTVSSGAASASPSQGASSPRLDSTRWIPLSALLGGLAIGGAYVFA